MTERAQLQLVLVHADESCLGNGADEPTPGGAGSLIELRAKGGIVRHDVFISSPDTTNNRMALSGAIATLALLAKKGKRLRVVFVSDSEYLVKGMNEWIAAWRARGWKRKGGEIENLHLWKQLDRVRQDHDVTWRWVRGHAGHAKNEYANDLAMKAAHEQIHSAGAVESGFAEWLARKRAYDRYTDYDPDADFERVERELASTS